MVRKLISSCVQPIQTLSSWFSPTTITEQIEELVDVPPGLRYRLREQVNQLPTPDPYQSTIRDALTQAIQAWQANPDIETNSLVVLGRSVEEIAPILKTSLKTDMADYDVRFFLGGYQRPLDPLTIPKHIKRELEPEEQVLDDAVEAPVTQTDLDNHVPTIMVVPSLEQCFLRCIQGWEGIEYLQSISTQDTSRFWVFGCNHWAWAFLERVCQVSAYLEQTIALPALTGEDLQTWLSPLLKTEIETPGPGIQIQEKAGHWNNLANAANGIASTAAQLWLSSLKIRADELTEDGTLADDLDLLELVPVKPTLPELMSLETIDRYVLHSLLIHREMTRSHLALSLGEADRNIRSRLQILRREGIILQRGRRLTVDPTHYPKLYGELGNNNFLLGQA